MYQGILVMDDDNWKNGTGNDYIPTGRGTAMFTKFALSLTRYPPELETPVRVLGRGSGSGTRFSLSALLSVNGENPDVSDSSIEPLSLNLPLPRPFEIIEVPF